METTHDVIVIGGGAAGRTAAAGLALARMRTLVIDPGAADPLAGPAGAGVLAGADVAHLDLSGPVKSVDVHHAGTFTAPAVILATGGGPYCATCGGGPARLGHRPDTTHLRGILDLNDAGEIRTDDSLATSLPGVFAAGDTRARSHRQEPTGAADGTTAALSAVRYIASLARHAPTAADRRRFLRTPARAAAPRAGTR